MKITITMFGRDTGFVLFERPSGASAKAPDDLAHRLEELERTTKREQEWKEWQATRGPVNGTLIGFAPNPRTIEESWRTWEPTS